MLFKIMRSKTSLLITHRLIGLENVDQILVLNNGQIFERGEHDDLINKQGIYQKLWKLQNRMLTNVYS